MIRIAHTSDLHFDLQPFEPAELAREFARQVARLAPDVLVVAGDLASDTGVYLDVLRRVAGDHYPVLVVPGNHCLWENPAVGSGRTSRDRHEVLLPALCEEAGAHALWRSPVVLDGVLFAGSYGHYDHSFQPVEYMHDDILRWKRWGGYSWGDKQYIVWPEFMRTSTRHGQYLDDGALCDILRARLRLDLGTRLADGRPPRAKVAVTHTVPFREGVTYLGSPAWDAMSAFIGSARLGEMFQEEKVDLAIYGHTHRHADLEVRGVRAVNSAVGYAEILDEWGHPPATPEERIAQCLRVTVI